MANENEPKGENRSKVKLYKTDSNIEYGTRLYTNTWQVEEIESFLNNLREDCIRKPNLRLQLAILLSKTSTLILTEADITSTISMSEEQSKVFLKTNALKIKYAESVTLFQQVGIQEPVASLFKSFVG